MVVGCVEQNKKDTMVSYLKAVFAVFSVDYMKQESLVKIMNRKQRRKMIKIATKNGVSKELAKAYAVISQGTGTHTEAKHFEEDDKLILDITAIKNRKNYPVMSQKYKDFVESSEGKIFTAHKENTNMISLKEEPQWLFWSGDLIKVEEVSEDAREVQ